MILRMPLPFLALIISQIVFPHRFLVILKGVLALEVGDSPLYCKLILMIGQSINMIRRSLEQQLKQLKILYSDSVFSPNDEFHQFQKFCLRKRSLKLLHQLLSLLLVSCCYLCSLLYHLLLQYHLKHFINILSTLLLLYEQLYESFFISHQMDDWSEFFLS